MECCSDNNWDSILLSFKVFMRGEKILWNTVLCLLLHLKIMAVTFLIDLLSIVTSSKIPDSSVRNVAVLTSASCSFECSHSSVVEELLCAAAELYSAIIRP